MKLLEFCKHGVYMTFAISSDNLLLLLDMADTPCEKQFEESAYFPALELHTTGTTIDCHHGARHVGGDRVFYKSHSESEDSICFVLENERLSCKLVYEFKKGTSTVRSHTEVTNISDEDIGLEYVSSFCIYGFNPKKIYIPHAGWCKEFDIIEYNPPELQLGERNRSQTKRVIISNTGTWSTKEHLPMGAVTTEGGRAFLWQIEHNGSWNYEMGVIEGKKYLKLSGPSEQENKWWKKLSPNETFCSVNAALTVVSGNLSDAVAGMTKYRRHHIYRSPADEYLPVIFNDYMRCLDANPTTEKLLPVIDAAAEAGAEIFCMDAGWYADGSWWDTVGEWEVCEKRFPNGMKEIFDRIREKGMVSGIWLEPESIGVKCPILDRFDDSCFFMRHGKRVIDNGRYQFDFRNPKVREFLDGVVDRLIREYGVGYFKLDYNIEGGAGTEVDADSFGDGLMMHNQAYLDWIDGIYKRYPNLILEACSSGGMRMDHKTLEHSSLCSLTDAGAYEPLTPIAQSSQFAVVPEQAAVWCVPRLEDSADEVAMNMVNAMFKRIHLSGKTPWIKDERFDIIKEGVEFYKSTRHLIPTMLPFYPCGFADFYATAAVVGYKNDERTYISVVNLGDADEIVIPYDNCNAASAVYPQSSKASILVEKDCLKVKLPAKSAVVISVD